MAKRALETLTTIATRLGGKSVNLLVFLVVARQLSLEEIAVYGFIFSTTLIYSAALDVGARNSLALFVGKQPEMGALYLRSGFFLWLTMALLGVPISYLTLFLSELPLNAVALSMPVALLLAAMLYVRIMQGGVLGAGDIQLFNSSELASRVVLFFGTVSLLLAPGGFTLVNAIWVLAASHLAAALFLFFKQIGDLRIPYKAGELLVLRIVARGFPFMLSVILLNAAKRFSFLVVSYTSSSEAAGIFFALHRLTEVITEVGLAIAVVAFSYSVRATSPNEAVQASAAMSRLSMLVFFAVAVLMVATIDVSLPLLLGPEFSSHERLFLLLIGATLAGAPWTILFPSLSVVLSPVKVFFLMVPGVAVNVITAKPLIALYGLEGAAFSIVLANIILTLSFLLVYRLVFHVPMSQFLFANRDDITGLFRLFRKFLSRAR